MSEIVKNLHLFNNSIPEEVTLVAVSKTKPVEAILEAYNSGHRDFGENKIQELIEKRVLLPNDINWHMIGHVQRNKVKYIADFVHLIHGVDSLKTLKEINKQATKHRKVIDCLLQVRIAKEETKFGIPIHEVITMVESDEFKELKNVQIKGLMGMASFTTDNDEIRSEFKSLSKLFNQLRLSTFPKSTFCTLSMGMSGDYQIAIEEGSNMVRVGSAIFGLRN